MAIPDYSLGQLAPSRVSDQFSQGLQDGMALRQAANVKVDRARQFAAEDAAAAAMKAKAEQDAAARKQQEVDFVDLVGKGLDKDASLLFAAKYPGAVEQLTKTYKLKTEMEQKQYLSQAQTLLAAGATDPKRASEIAKRYADAHRNTPGMKDQAEALDRLSEQLLTSTDTATATLSLFLGGAMEPKDYADTVQKVSQAQALAKKAGADADKAAVDAKFAEQKALADIGLTEQQAKRYAAQTNIEWARLKLDREKAAAEALAALQNRVDDATKLSSDAFKLVSDAGSSAVASRMIAAEADDIAKAMIENPSLGGVEGTWAEKMKAATGSEDGLTALRQRFAGLKAKGIYQALGKGTKTDDDYAQFEKGFPADSASSAQKAAFLRGMAKAARFTAATEDAQADYVSRNGAPSNAKADLVVGGVSIPAGTTYSNAIGMVQAAERQKDVDAAAAEKAPALAKDADALRSKYKKAP